MKNISARVNKVASHYGCSEHGCNKMSKHWAGESPVCWLHYRKWKKNFSNIVIRGCINCGKSFPANGQKKLTCTAECSKQWQSSHRKRIKQIEGGAEKLSLLEKKRRSTDESKRKQSIYDRSRYGTPEKLAKEKERWRKYDSRPERKAAKKLADHLRNNSEEGRLRIRQQSSKRRAIILGNGAKPYEVINIFKRDKFICQICHKKVSKKEKWPHPLSASIDHIIPVSSGGPDAPHNIQTTHLRCNLVKHAKAFGQLFFDGFG